MEPNDPFDALVRPSEGSRLTVYDDATGKPIVPGTLVRGHPTIGIGRALDTHGISVTEEALLYQNDKRAVYLSVATALPWFPSLDATRQAVIASMAFQMGLGGLLQFHNTLSLVQAGKYDAAAAEMLESLWAKETPARANLLASVLRSGDISSAQSASTLT